MAVTNLVRVGFLAALVPLAVGLAGCKKDAGSATSAASPAATPLASAAPPAGKSWAETITVTPEGGYRMGNPDAPVKIVEYGSLSCPHCAEFSEKSTPTIRDKWVPSGRVSYEFRNYALHAPDVPMELLTRCGPAENYFALIEQVFANYDALVAKWQANSAAVEQAASLPDAQRFIGMSQALGLLDFFSARGISVDQAKTCLGNFKNAEALINAQEAQTKQYNIEGTPTFIINGAKANVNSWEEVKAQIEGLGVR